MKNTKFSQPINKYGPPILVGLSIYSGLKFILEMAGIFHPSLTPYDTAGLIAVGLFYLFERYVPMNPLLALCPSVIVLAFCNDFFSVFLENDVYSGRVVTGLSIVIGICVYLIHFFIRNTGNKQEESPKSLARFKSLCLSGFRQPDRQRLFFCTHGFPGSPMTFHGKK